MSTEFENGQDKLNDSTRDDLKNLSRAMLRLHKTLLDASKLEYEAKNGAITNVYKYFQLVTDDPHFEWLRKISMLIALIDEAVSIRRPATELEAKGLQNEAQLLLNFQDADENFNEKFQNALQNNKDAVLHYNDALQFVVGK